MGQRPGELQVRTNKSILVAVHIFVELGVTSLFCLGDRAVEDSDPVSVQNFNTACLKVLGKLPFIVKVPVLITEEAKALAKAAALWFLLLFGLSARAALATILDRFDRGLWK